MTSFDVLFCVAAGVILSVFGYVLAIVEIFPQSQFYFLVENDQQLIVSLVVFISGVSLLAIVALWPHMKK